MRTTTSTRLSASRSNNYNRANKRRGVYRAFFILGKLCVRSFKVNTMSQAFIETPRLLLRELTGSDLQDFFRLESDRVVQEHVTALTNSTITTVEHAEDVLYSIIG